MKDKTLLESDIDEFTKKMDDGAEQKGDGENIGVADKSKFLLYKKFNIYVRF